MKKIILILALIGYINSLSNDFTFDDHSYIEKNPFITSIKGVLYVAFSPIKEGEIHRGHLYRPFSLLVGYLINKIFGLKPIVFHAFNIFFHSINCILIFLLLEKFKIDKFAIFVCTALFAIHPIHTEAVTSAVGMTELLAFLLGIAGAILLISLKKTYYPMIMLLLFLSFVSKETSVMFILFYLFIASYSYKKSNGRITLRFCMKIFFVILVPLVVYFLLRLHIMGQFLRAHQVQFSFVDNPLVEVSAYSRVLTSFHILFKYFVLFFYPANLCADYSYDTIAVINNALDKRFIIALIFLFIVFIYCFFELRGKRYVEFISILIFFIGLLPVSNILFVSGTMLGERFLYLPSFGLCLFMASILRRLRATKKNWIYVSNIILILIGITLIITTIVRNIDWKDDKMLFESVLKVAPRNVKASYNLGVIYMKEGSYNKAEYYFNRALNIYPLYYDAYMGFAFMHYYKGEWENALKEVKYALDIFKKNENAYALLAELYSKLGQKDKVIETYLEGIKNLPATFLLNYKVALEYFKVEDWGNAKKHFASAAIVNDIPEIHYYLGRCYLYQGNKKQAINEFEQSYPIYKEKPEIIKFLAYLYLEQGEYLKAKELALNYVNEFPQDAEGFALTAKILWEAFNNGAEAYQYIQIAYTKNARICQYPPFVKICNELLN